MGNDGNNFCQNSNYMCNIFPIKNKEKKNSITMHIKNNTHTSINSSIPLSSRNQIENGGKIYDLSNSTYSHNQNKNSSKFFLLNPNTKNNKEIRLNNKKKAIIYRNKENKEKKLFKNNSDLNFTEKKKIFVIADMKHNFNNKSLMIKNYNKIIDKIKSDSKIKNNSSDEEEMDTINNNLSQDEFSITSNLDSVKKSQNTENIIKTNIENRNESSAKKAEDGMKIINEEEEKKELKDSEYENKISEKEIELIEKSCKSNQSKENDNNSKNFIKGLKYSNFEYSYETHINANNHRHFSFIGPKMNKLKVNDNNLEKKLNASSCSIPDARHLDPSKPLNYLMIKRKIQTSLYPLNKNSFNIITYKEDNAQQFSYFKNGIANGITKYIINKNNSIIFEGEFEDGYPKGYGKYTLKKEGREYEGVWDKEILLGIESYKDGTIYMGDFKNNLKEGIGIYRWPDGTIYYGEWKNDNMDGFCHIKYANDRAYTGHMEKGLKNGYGEFSWKPTRKYIGNYINDLKEGFGIYIWNIKSFIVYVGLWHEGKMEGIGLMINGTKRYYGKWYKGEKVEFFKNEKDLKLKYKSTQLNMATSLIRRRSLCNIQNDKNKVDINQNRSFSNKKLDHVKAKQQIDKCINFLCKDFKFMKSFIIKLFIKSNKF